MNLGYVARFYQNFNNSYHFECSKISILLHYPTSITYFRKAPFDFSKLEMIPLIYLKFNHVTIHMKYLTHISLHVS
jgi:hypothetical protein